MKTIVRLAMRNLGRRKARSFSLALGAAFGCFMLTVVYSTIGGMRESLLEKAAVYYGGDFSVLGHRDDGFQTTDRVSGILSALESIPGGRILASPRTEDRSKDIFLVAGGKSVRQKMLSGVEWEREGEFLARLVFVEGAPPREKGASGILISEPVAASLGVRSGDRVVILTSTLTGQRTSASLLVQGIFRDSSLFGQYTVYLARGELNPLLGYGADWATYVGGRFARGARIPLDSIQRVLEEHVSMFPRVASKGLMEGQTAQGGWSGIRHSLLGLDAHVYQIRYVADVFALMGYAIALVLLGMSALGLSTSFRMIVTERRREIGTMRALGMGAQAVALLFLVEALALVTVASAAGLGAGRLALSVIARIDVSGIPGFDVFLSSGRLAPRMDMVAALFVVLVMLAVSLISVAGSVARAARVSPAEAFRSE